MNVVRVDPYLVLASKRDYYGFGAELAAKIKYFPSADLSDPVEIKIKKLEGIDPEACSYCWAECSLSHNGEPLCAPVRTSFSTGGSGSCGGGYREGGGTAEWPE
eukprot:RCo028540